MSISIKVKVDNHIDASSGALFGRGTYNNKKAFFKVTNQGEDNDSNETENYIYTKVLTGDITKNIVQCYGVISMFWRDLFPHGAKYNLTERINVLILEDMSEWGRVDAWLSEIYILLDNDIKEETLQHLLSRVALVLIAFEKMGLMHNDLHTENIFIQADDISDIKVKIFDFDNSFVKNGPKNVTLEMGGCAEFAYCNKFIKNKDWFTFVDNVHDDLKKQKQSIKVIESMCSTKAVYNSIFTKPVVCKRRGCKAGLGIPCFCTSDGCGKCKLDIKMINGIMSTGEFVKKNLQHKKSIKRPKQISR